MMADRRRAADRIDAEDLLACRTLLRGGSRSFFAASLLLPRRVMEPAAALYAFCRVADDLIDGPAGAGALDTLRDRLDLVYARQPHDHPADRALATVVAAHRLPRALLDALLEGFAWDAEGRHYDDLAGLQAYAARVAGAVGAMMAVLMGVRSADLVARACDLGVAMQLSNIARDVGEDAANGRLYLPRRWLREAGIDPDAWLRQPVYSPALGGVVLRLLKVADTLYARAGSGIAGLPLDCRPGIGAAQRLYAAIGHRVVAAGGNSVDARAVVPLSRKLWLLAGATGAAVLPGGAADAAALPATRYLVAAVDADPVPYAPGRLEWLLNLFADLDSRQTAASTGQSGA